MFHEIMPDNFYQTKQWWRLRGKLTKQAKRCKMCGRIFLPTDTKVVDHIKPRKLHPELALEESNLMVIHKTPCHDSWKKRQEFGSERAEVGLDGWNV